jgi:hypothetical protein
MVVYLEMTAKGVTLFSSMFYITDYQCANQYTLSEQFHLTRMPHRCPVLQSYLNQNMPSNPN